MDLFNVLYVRNTGKIVPHADKIVPHADIIDNLWGKHLYAQAHGGIEKTVTGNPILITDAKGGFAKALSITFSPKQSGSGDPSPDNIRPISGYANIGLDVNSTQHTIPLGGTYYGGVVDVERGVLRADVTKLSINDTSNWSQSQGYITSGIISNMMVTDKYKGLCNWLPVLSTVGRGILIGSNSRRLYVGDVVLTDLGLADIEEWKTYLGNHPLEVTIPLATPIEIDLTPQAIALLKGSNTLWTDGDTMDLTYLAKA